MAVAPTSRATLTTRVDTDTMRTLGRCVERLAQHLLALGQGEQRLGLLGVAHGGHDHLVEEAPGPLDHLEVAVVERVERPGEEGDGHGLAFLASARHVGRGGPR